MANRGYWLDSNGNDKIYSLKLADIVAGNTRTKKLFWQNDRSAATGSITAQIKQFATSDLDDLIQWALCPITLSCPYNVSLTLQAGGSLTASTTYYYRITAFNENGETTGSIEKSITTDTSNKTILVEWDVISGADGYIIYRSTLSGSYSNSRRDVIEDGSITSYTDTNQNPDPSSAYSWWPAINTDFDLPSENTTAGESPDYGTPPTLSVSDISVGIVQPGQQICFWFDVETLITTPIGNKQAYFSFLEA